MILAPLHNTIQCKSVRQCRKFVESSYETNRASVHAVLQRLISCRRGVPRTDYAAVHATLA